ncbi:NRPS-like enzyme [Penicillium macrosclerotiorum]|uniref:NRPS-like enzyme n=1 Tax=Penicillium macrosclerotiorum TaxID=303699 RepID=UPI0025497B18|nr:NRPS-like enzyme [Penicillium macrosclerotiorum]KAJ5679718.1 NRPS-like enzyme [Penicillium macrosclerotiorum]
MSKKLIPCILDELSTLNPDKLYAEVPVSPRGYELGTRNITYKNLANAVNGLARWLTSTLGPGQNFQTISYIGPNDLGHNIALIAAVKAGYRLLLTSPRYGTVGQVKLMKQVNCNDLLVSAETESKIPGALSAEHQNLRKWTLPSLNELFDTDHRRFEYTKSYEEAKRILWSSFIPQGLRDSLNQLSGPMNGQCHSLSSGS